MLGQRPSIIARCHLATVRFTQNRTNLSFVAGDDLSRIISRRIIHDNDLNLGVILGQRTVDRLSQERSIIVIWDYDTNTWYRHHLSSFANSYPPAFIGHLAHIVGVSQYVVTIRQPISFQDAAL